MDRIDLVKVILEKCINNELYFSSGDDFEDAIIIYEDSKKSYQTTLSILLSINGNDDKTLNLYTPNIANDVIILTDDEFCDLSELFHKVIKKSKLNLTSLLHSLAYKQ